MYHGFGKFIRGKMFSALFLLFSVCLIFYVSFRLDRLVAYLTSHRIYVGLFCFFSILTGYMLFYQKSKKENKKTYLLHKLCSIVLCFILNLVLCLLVFDGIKIFTDFNRIEFYLIPVAFSVLLSIYGFFHARHIAVKRYSVHLGDKDRHLTAALLSDIHLGTFVNKKQLQKIIDKVNQLKCDYVFIAGDMFDVEAFEHCNLPETAEQLKKLKPEKRIFAALGNHDPVASNSKLLQFFREANIRLLIDEKTETEDFIIIGREDIHTNPNRQKLSDIMQEENFGKPVIVIDHNPVGIEEGISEAVDLVLCGHTHKGQFFPATLFTRWSYGKKGFYGYAKTKNTNSIVSSGVGYFQMPMRTGTDSEIVVLDIEI